MKGKGEGEERGSLEETFGEQRPFPSQPEPFSPSFPLPSSPSSYSFLERICFPSNKKTKKKTRNG